MRRKIFGVFFNFMFFWLFSKSKNFFLIFDPFRLPSDALTIFRWILHFHTSAGFFNVFSTLFAIPYPANKFRQFSFISIACTQRFRFIHVQLIYYTLAQSSSQTKQLRRQSAVKCTFQALNANITSSICLHTCIFTP